MDVRIRRALIALVCGVSVLGLVGLFLGTIPPRGVRIIAGGVSISGAVYFSTLSPNRAEVPRVAITLFALGGFAIAASGLRVLVGPPWIDSIETVTSGLLLATALLAWWALAEHLGPEISGTAEEIKTLR